MPYRTMWALLALVAVLLVLRWAPTGSDPALDEGLPADAFQAGDAVSGSGSTQAERAETSDEDTEEESQTLLATSVDGVACDGESVDDLQAAFDQAAGQQTTLLVPRGAQCLLDETLQVPSGIRVEAAGATVTGVPGAFSPRPDRESLIRVAGVSDVSIAGGVWQMADGEGANVFEIRDSSQVDLRALTATGAGEDGFYLGPPESEDVTLDAVLAVANGRSGISITTGRDIRISDSQAHDNGDLLHMRGLAIEPNSAGGPLTGIHIDHLLTSGNSRSGAAVSLANLDADDEDVDIVFDGYRSFDEPVGLRISDGTVGGSVRVLDAHFERTGGVALQLKDRWASAFEVDIVRPVIDAWGVDPRGRPRADSAISIYTSDDEADEPLGGVRISNPTIVGHSNAGDHAYYLYVGDNRADPSGVEDIELLHPLRLEAGRGLSLDGSVWVGTGGGSDGLSAHGDDALHEQADHP